MIDCNTKKSINVGDVRLTLRKTGMGDEVSIRYYKEGIFSEAKTGYEDGMESAMETRCAMVRRLEKKQKKRK